MQVYFPLIPETKRPKVRGWAAEDYPGVTPEPGGWYGLRADDLVIIDCDSREAAQAWGAEHPDTLVVQTPRGYHFYYRWTPGSPTGPAVGVLPGVDVRAGRGSYVVWEKAPGYCRIVGPSEPTPFDPSWLPEKATTPVTEAEAWDVIPDGQRNSTLAALGGSLRKQGMSARAIAETLGAMNKVYCDPPLPQDEVIGIAKSVSRYEPDPDTAEPVVWLEGSAYDVQWAGRMKLPPPPKWYWHPYFPEGKLVFMDGREGIGKGMFATYLAMSRITGQNPDGTTSTPSNVLWLPTEDDPEEDILRRLFAAGYRPGQGADVGFVSARIKVPEQEDLLQELILEHGAKLVILDPGRSYLGPEAGANYREFSYNNEAHIRPGMESLIRIAKQTGATILFVHHWNKDTKSDIFNRQSGSGGFNQVIRHRVTVARVEHEGYIDGAFAVVKSNIAQPGHVHGFTLEEDHDYQTARFVLKAPMPEWGSLDEWYKAAQEARDDEVAWIPADKIVNDLAWELTEGAPLPSRPALAKATGLSERKVTDALNRLLEDGVITGGGHGKPYIWVGAK